MQYIKHLLVSVLFSVSSSMTFAQDTESAAVTWGDIEYKGHPWVENVSLPYKTNKGQPSHLPVGKSWQVL